MKKTSVNKFDKNNFFGKKIASIEKTLKVNLKTNCQQQKVVQGHMYGCEPHLRHIGSPVLYRTVVDNTNSCSLDSILEDNLCHKTTCSRKIELNKHMYNKKVKTTTALEALSSFICFT